MRIRKDNDSRYALRAALRDTDGNVIAGDTITIVSQEVDPVFTASPAGTITQTDINNWNAGTGGSSYYTVGPTAPTSPSEGDLWYDTVNESVYAWNEVSTGVFNWVAISYGTGTSNVLDGGSY